MITAKKLGLPNSLILRNAIFGLIIAALSLIPTFAQDPAQMQGSSSKRAIISPTLPKDSWGETVYESQGDKQKDVPVVQGVLSPPVGVKLPAPKYPKSLKKSKTAADVTLEGIVTATGDFIDAKVIDESDPIASASALAAASQYKFKPATLDGKPIAVLVHVVLYFRIR